MQHGRRHTVTVEERSDSRYWQARMYLEGEGGSARRWSTGVVVGNDKRVSQREAARVAEKRAAEIAREVFGAEVDSRYALDAVAERMLKKKTIDRRRTGAVGALAFNLDKHVKPFFDDARDVREIRKANLEAFKAHLCERYSAPTTINNALTAIRQVLKHACQHEEILEAVPYVENLPVPKKSLVAKPISREQAKRYLRSFDDDEAREFNLWLLETGLRKSESLALLWEWIDWERREANIPGEARKGGREQRVPTALSATVVAMLRARRKRKRQPIKGRVWYRFKNGRYDSARQRAAKKAGIAGFRHHDARHTKATWLGDSGATEIELRDFFNWETTAMASRYTHPNRAKMHELAARVTVTGKRGGLSGVPSERSGDFGKGRKTTREGKTKRFRVL
jgi:integrase